MPYSTPLDSPATNQGNHPSGYHEAAPAGPQARLRGSVALTPDIDLSAYTCRAVIDWVEVMFVRTVTQHRWVQECLQPVTGERHYVKMSRPGDGGESCQFSVRFQEPRLEMVTKAAAAIHDRFGLTTDPLIVELEVSVDFKPKVQSADVRLLMTGVLTRHLFPDRPNP